MGNNKFNKYCKKCREWVMATEIITDKVRKTSSGFTRLAYVCPKCGSQSNELVE